MAGLETGQKVPAMHYEMMIYFQYKITGDEIKDYYDKHIENERTNAEEFVFISNLLANIIKVHVKQRNNTTTD